MVAAYEKSWRGRSDKSVEDAMIVYKWSYCGLAWSTVMGRQHMVFRMMGLQRYSTLYDIDGTGRSRSTHGNENSLNTVMKALHRERYPTPGDDSRLLTNKLNV